jgi:electron transfer flavoprotein alpha subunit
MSVLVIAEHNNKELKPATLNTVMAAMQLGSSVDVLIAGSQTQAVADSVAKLQGVTKVLQADNAAYEYHLAENMAELIAEIGKQYSHILFPATTSGKNIAPRVAALLDVAQISDVVSIIDQDTFAHPIYAGNAIATLKSSDTIKVLTIRTTAFDPVQSGGSAPIENISVVKPNNVSSFVKEELVKLDRPELTAARVIVSGGRALQSGENFTKLLIPLADKLNAAIGASRAAVDAGYADNDMQVGQTGKIVAPDLYIAIGISGAIQHLAGMKSSKVIVAINKDEDAPIFGVADYGLVGDLFEILPKLQQLL